MGRSLRLWCRGARGSDMFRILLSSCRLYLLLLFLVSILALYIFPVSTFILAHNHSPMTPPPPGAIPTRSLQHFQLLQIEVHRALSTCKLPHLHSRNLLNNNIDAISEPESGVCVRYVCYAALLTTQRMRISIIVIFQSESGVGVCHVCYPFHC